MGTLKVWSPDPASRVRGSQELEIQLEDYEGFRL